MIEDDPEIIVCAGPPACLLAGEDAIAAAKEGCPLCKHIVVHDEESETEYHLKAH